MSEVTCSFNRCFGGSKCKNKRSCSCRCGDLKAVNIHLHDACVTSCQSDSSWENVPSGSKWMCNTYGGEFLFSHYKINECGFDPLDTIEGKLFLEKEEKKKEVNSYQKQLILALGSVALILMVAFLYFKYTDMNGSK